MHAILSYRGNRHRLPARPSAHHRQDQLQYTVPLCLARSVTMKQYTYTYSVLTAIFPGEPGLAGCPINSPSPFIPGLHILLGHA